LLRMVRPGRDLFGNEPQLERDAVRLIRFEIPKSVRL